MSTNLDLERAILRTKLINKSNTIYYIAYFHFYRLILQVKHEQSSLCPADSETQREHGQDPPCDLRDVRQIKQFPHLQEIKFILATL